MEGVDGIEDSWLFTSHGLRTAAGVALDLSKLRPRGTDNGKGLISSGVASFARFYSLLNEELRRGGTFKNGAVTLFLDADHQDLEDFLFMGDKLPWAKRGLYITDEIWHSLSDFKKKWIARKVNNGEVWLAKKRWDSEGNRLYSNVCLEVLIESRATCMLSSHNLGLETVIEKIPGHMEDSMDYLCRLHGQTEIGNDGYYLNHHQDKQVGLGVIGLANLLGIHNVTYADFTTALESVLANEALDVDLDNKAERLALAIYTGYQRAAQVAKWYGMKRAFAIAPTASLSYRHKDAQGYTTAPEISPPLAREIDRDSDTFGVTSHTYHPNSELAVTVGWGVYWRLANAWQRLQDSTGLGHAMSVNLWTSFTVTPEWIEKTFLPSDLVTTYYRLPIDQEALDKSEVVTPESSEEKLRPVYDFDVDELFESVDDDDPISGDLPGLYDDPDYVENIAYPPCGLDDPQHCSSCG